MEATSLPPPPPDLEGLTWRPIDRADLGALGELAEVCYQADGGLYFMITLENLTERFFPEAPGAAVGAFTPDGRLAACAAVHLSGDGEARRAVIAGYVRPDLRGRGIGDYLMRWSRAQGRALLAESAAGGRVLQVATEGLSEPADRLYRAHGFTCVFEERVMDRDLQRPLPQQTFPPDVRIVTWQLERAEQFYRVYYPAFRDRPGFPGWSQDEFADHVTGNDLIPEWTLLALSSDGPSGNSPAGYVIGCIDLDLDPPGGFVWQVGVVPDQRRRGIASALLVESMRRMQAQGAPSAQLAVHVNNPGAIRAYERLGFATIGRRARYERDLEG